MTSMKIIVGAILFALALIFAHDAKATEYTCDNEFTAYVANELIAVDANVFIFCFPEKYKSGVAYEEGVKLRGRITINGEVFPSEIGVPGGLGTIDVPGNIQLSNPFGIILCDSDNTKCSEAVVVTGTFHSGDHGSLGKPRVVPEVP